VTSQQVSIESFNQDKPVLRRLARLADLTVLSASAAMILWTSQGCSTFSAKQIEAQYSPSEGILETVAVLRRHVPDNTYRFPPASDFSGRNVYRASLLRLESLERAEANAMRSGYMDDVIAFAKARALERLRAFDLAAQHYRESARLSSELGPVAFESALICERIDQAIKIGIELGDPFAEAGVEPLSLDFDSVRTALDERIAILTRLLAEVQEDHYRWIVQEEIERADWIRAQYAVAIRSVVEDGTLLALQELQRVVTRHGASKNRLQHLLRLADFYAMLGREYLAAVPPESLAFDPAKFRELFDAAIQLYELVAGHDGRPEKLEAAHSLEAFLALTLSIDADRFDR
jgi:tetratricopeptide (TPR) repeat protein